MRAHATAVISNEASIAEDVVLGPFAIVEADVSIGAGCVLEAHACVRSGTRLGANNVVHPFAVLGGEPQAHRYSGEPTLLEIGASNIFREHVTVNRGTAQGGGVTRIGSGGLFMACVHVGHDARVGDGVTLANATLVAGHVQIADHVVVGGNAAIAPFVHIGTRAFLAGGAMVERDVPPFVIVQGDRARVRALNEVGLERGGVPEASRVALQSAFRSIFRSGWPRAAAASALLESPDPFVRELARFVAAPPRPR